MVMTILIVLKKQVVQTQMTLTQPQKTMEKNQRLQMKEEQRLIQQIQLKIAQQNNHPEKKLIVMVMGSQITKNLKPVLI